MCRVLLIHERLICQFVHNLHGFGHTIGTIVAWCFKRLVLAAGNGIVSTHYASMLWVYWTWPFLGFLSLYWLYKMINIEMIIISACTLNPDINNRHIHLVFAILIYEGVRSFMGQ